MSHSSTPLRKPRACPSNAVTGSKRSQVYSQTDEQFVHWPVLKQLSEVTCRHSGHVAFRPEPTITGLMRSPKFHRASRRRRLHRYSGAYDLDCRSELPVITASSVLPIEFVDYIRFNRASLKSSAVPRVISTRRERKPKAVSDFH